MVEITKWSNAEYWLWPERHKLVTPTWSTWGIGHLADSHVMEGTTNTPRQSKYLPVHKISTAATMNPAKASSNYQRPRLHALGAMSTFLYASLPKHHSPRGVDVGAFQENLPQVTHCSIEATTQ
jgi:hypothetical protein